MIRIPGANAPPAGLPERTPWRGGVYVAAFALTPLFAYLWPLGFAVLVPLASAALLPLWARPQPAWPVVALAFALALWGAGALAWSPALASVDPRDPETQLGLKLLVQVPAYGFFAAAAGGLSGRAAQRALGVLAAGLVVLGAVLVVEGAAAAWAYRQLVAAFAEAMPPDLAERNIGKGQFVLALLAWPALVFLYREARRFVPLLVGTLLLCPFLLNELAPVAALAAGGAAFVVVRAAGPWGARALGLLLALQLLVTPWIVRAAAAGGVLDAMGQGAPESWRQRLEVWAFASERVLERPWLGWGLEAARTFPQVPLHPHNAALQVWIELGLIGALLLALLWLRVFESVARVAARDRTAAAACAGAAGAYFTVGALSYGVWQEWWLAIAALLAAVCTALVVGRDHQRLAAPLAPLHPTTLRPL